MRKQTIAQQWPCIFKGSYIREHIDPLIKKMFAAWSHTNETPKFGDMRAIWRRLHCQTLNPYGSENCPFKESECGLAFQLAVSETLRAKPRRFGALFRYVSRRTGAERADAAQGSRHRGGGSRGQVQGHHPAMGKPAEVVHGGHRRPGRGDGDVPSGAGEPLRSPDRRPHRLGTLLGSLDIGPRTPNKGRDDGEEGTE